MTTYKTKKPNAPGRYEWELPNPEGAGTYKTAVEVLVRDGELWIIELDSGTAVMPVKNATQGTWTAEDSPHTHAHELSTAT